MSTPQSQGSRYFSKYHTSEAALARRFRSVARGLAFVGTTGAHAKIWQKRARRKFAELLGLQHFVRCKPAAKLINREQLDCLMREEWLIQTEPGTWMPYYLLIPDAYGDKPLPLVLCPHGHGSGGKWTTAGRVDIPEVAAKIASSGYDYGVQIARTGFITVCPDARGFGQRREPLRQNDNPDLNGSCHQLMLSGAPLGLTVQGMWTWDLMRLVDHLIEDRRIDKRRIGVAGLSGGGLQALNLAALDLRVQAAVVSGYFYGVRESLQIENNNCACNLVPHLWEHFDMGDVGALIAPRGLFIETGDQDKLNGASNLANVRSQVRIARKTYAALSATPKLQHRVFSGGHRWNGERSIPWLKQMLSPSER
jgi:dienelactone hydrolase